MEGLAVTKTNAVQPNKTSSFMPTSQGVLQRQCSCGNHSTAGGECAECASKKLQRKLTIGSSSDPLEHEADRVADQIVSSEFSAISSSKSASARLQRQEASKEKSDAEKYKEGATKLGEEFLKTPMGKQLVENIKQDALVRGVTDFGDDFISTWQGKVITGAGVAGTVAALAAAHKELPLQIPEIPLDKWVPGLSVKLIYSGPVDKPTDAMLTFKFTEQVKKSSNNKKSPSASDKYRAETARMAADMAKFRAGMTYKSNSPKGSQQEAEIKNNPSPTAPEQNKKQDDTVIQKKLSIGASNDPLEHEADRVAEQVMANEPAHSFSNFSEPKIQRRTEQPSSQSEEVPASVEKVLSGSGSPLPPTVRIDMEQRFGHDFSHVRMHSGTAAEKSARDVCAKAYTVGHNVVFGAGKFAPGMHEGRRLIAHELTHVVQQSGSDGIGVTQGREKNGFLPISHRSNANTAILARKSDGDTDKYCHITNPTKALEFKRVPGSRVDASIDVARLAALRALKDPPENARALEMLETIQTFLREIVTEENIRKTFPGETSMRAERLSAEGIDSIRRMIGAIRSGESTLCGLWDSQYTRLLASRLVLKDLARESLQPGKLAADLQEASDRTAKFIGTVTLILISGGVASAANTAFAGTATGVLRIAAGTRVATLIIASPALAEELFLVGAGTVFEIVDAGGFEPFLRGLLTIEGAVKVLTTVLHLRVAAGAGSKNTPGNVVEATTEVQPAQANGGKTRIRTLSPQVISPESISPPTAPKSVGSKPATPSVSIEPPQNIVPKTESPKAESLKLLTAGKPVPQYSSSYGKAAEQRIINSTFASARKIAENTQTFDAVEGGTSTFSESKARVKGLPVKGITETLEGARAITIKTVPRIEDATPDHVKSVITSALDDVDSYFHFPNNRLPPVDPTPVAPDTHTRIIIKNPSRITVVVEIGKPVTEELRVTAEKAGQDFKAFGPMPPIDVIVRQAPAPTPTK
jgi:hypothetical protein